MKQYSHRLTHALYLGAALIAIGFFGMSALSYAAAQGTAPVEESNPRAKLMMENMEDRSDMMQEGRENMASNTEVMREQIQERRSVLSEKIQDRVYNLLQNIIGRMNAAAERMRAIGNRMEMRARILGESGADVTEAMAQIEKSRTSIGAATTILRSDLGAFVLTEKPREQFAQVRTSIKEAGSHIKDSRDALRLALAALKTASQNVKPAAATTPITSPVPLSE